MRRLLVTASVGSSSPILVTLMKKTLSFSETSLLIRVTRHNIPEDAILQYIWVYRLFDWLHTTDVKFCFEVIARNILGNIVNIGFGSCNREAVR
jgi:hypothetical protein